MKVSIIVAKSENNVIGKDNALPWHLPIDMAYFKRITTDHHVIMGRKTFESIKSRPLPNRTNIIISTNPDYDVPLGCFLAKSLEEALSMAEENGECEAFVIGGNQIYRLAIPIADRIYMTVVHTDIEGDTFFPDYDISEWKETKSEYHKADEKNKYACSFKLYELIK